jgi:hypothetical protein
VIGVGDARMHPEIADLDFDLALAQEPGISGRLRPWPTTPPC